jgi:glutamine amidotransferase
MRIVSPVYFEKILGSTDSELMFHLALSFGLEQHVPAAISEMVRVVESTAKEQGIGEAIWMTLGISDGKTLWGFRYGSNGKGPTLYASPNITELELLSPGVAGKIGAGAVCLVSEPIGKYQDLWQLIPENSKVTISAGAPEISVFHP